MTSTCFSCVSLINTGGQSFIQLLEIANLNRETSKLQISCIYYARSITDFQS